MCTSLTLQGRDFYFGRNLDLECSYGQQLVIAPRNFPIPFRKSPGLDSHYALIGMAAVSDGYPLYADAVNEKGLCIAGLNFPGYAYYPPEEAAGKANISPFELPLWLLGQCASLKEARELLQRTHLLAIDFSPELKLSPLHWHLADASGSLTLEATRSGLQILENPVGVLTNSPPFDFHLNNLRQYLNLTPRTPVNRFHEGLKLTPFGRGMGALGLPGDASPASRFVRAAFLKWNSLCPPENDACVIQFFHLLQGVAMTRGSVEAPDGRWELTQYSACMNASRGIYYYQTYENPGICAVRLEPEGAQLKKWPLVEGAQILFRNE